MPTRTPPLARLLCLMGLHAWRFHDWEYLGQVYVNHGDGWQGYYRRWCRCARCRRVEQG